MRYVTCRTAEQVAKAIRDMVVRGAPAIGCAAAFGVVLGKGSAKAYKVLRASRPTAVNLFWALDRMRELLAERGIENALLDFGGSSWLALGAPADAPAWRVLLRDGRGGYAGTIALRDVSVSFSESFGESSEIEGRRYGHVIDPRTGWPVTEPLAGVALAADGASAEALTKALIVLGAPAGLAVVAEMAGAEALVIDAAGALHESPGFRRATGFEPLP
jgi:thiamine biosynthesis lipoprotein ApbE